jgi:uncharacterized protein (DUF302 family)
MPVLLSPHRRRVTAGRPNDFAGPLAGPQAAGMPDTAAGRLVSGRPNSDAGRQNLLHVLVGKLQNDRYLPLHLYLVALIGNHRTKHYTAARSRQPRRPLLPAIWPAYPSVATPFPGDARSPPTGFRDRRRASPASPHNEASRGNAEVIVNGLMTRRSTHGVPETVAAIRGQAEQHGATVVAVVDHAAAAQAAGLTMPATQVIIFGNPKTGTPIMQAAPEVAIDLPLRVMVRDDGQPGSLVTWQDPAYVGDRFALHDDQLTPLATPQTLIAAALDQG